MVYWHYRFLNLKNFYVYTDIKNGGKIMDENKKLTPEEIEELIKSGEITEDELEKISGGTGMDYIQYLHLKKKRTYDKDDW